MDNKGQGALEYLLLIGGAVLIAAIVIVILNALGSSGRDMGTNAGLTANNELEQMNQIDTSWD